MGVWVNIRFFRTWVILYLGSDTYSTFPNLENAVVTDSIVADWGRTSTYTVQASISSLVRDTNGCFLCISISSSPLNNWSYTCKRVKEARQYRDQSITRFPNF